MGNIVTTGIGRLADNPHGDRRHHNDRATRDEVVLVSLLQGAPRFDRGEARHVPEDHSPALHVSFDLLQNLLSRLPLFRQRRGGAEDPSNVGDEKLKEDEPTQRPKHREDSLHEKCLPRHAQVLDHTLNRLEEQDGDEDGDRGRDHLPGVLHDVLVSVVDQVQDEAYEADAAQEHACHTHLQVGDLLFGLRTTLLLAGSGPGAEHQHGQRKRGPEGRRPPSPFRHRPLTAERMPRF
mmetsp:Transcript_48520/g.139334  ORF Transcript_48520/g.139334 Transcript_48520/m.139334 type:complete len:236 (+) Transcript_48520:1202-1909(+)